MNDVSATDPSGGRPQTLAIEEFFYFFLRLRKNEVRRVVRVLRERYPDESPRRLARRLVDAKTGLAAIGGGLLYLPQMLPGLGQGLKLLGVVGAGSMLTRMHLYLILEIAAVYGEDIDDTARVMEMVAVVAATGIGAAAPTLVARFNLSPLYWVPAGALSMTLVTRLIGLAATRLYEARTAAAPDGAVLAG
jgi:hypothetical protein